VDLAKDRLTVAGQLRLLGELTRAALLEDLTERRDRCWLYTVNAASSLSRAATDAAGSAPSASGGS
jgi:hypothetical protein